MRLRFPVTVIWLAIAACTNSTSLAGSTSCGETTCRSGQLCVEQESGIANDAGVATTTAGCVTVGEGCLVSDCEGTACPTCIAKLCADYPSFNDPTLRGRILSCPGE